MPASWKGIIAGFVATVVLSLIFAVLNGIGILPQLDIVTLIDRLGSIGRVAAWVDHFIVGMFLWGPIFSGFDSTFEAKWPRWQRGLIFGVITWFLMMIIFMPVVGAGLFGLQLGWMEPVGMLFMNLIYGLIIGLVYDVLDQRYPTKSVMPATFAANEE